MALRIKASQAALLVIAAGYLVMLALNLPGHLTHDSVIQLHEGRFRVRETWAPAIYGAILGVFDRLLPGTSLYVAASGLLFFGGLAALIPLRPQTSWAVVPVALVIVCSPLVLIYQGIVWKDVLFANCAVAGCICLAHAAKAWKQPLPRAAWLLGALLLLGLASLVRQNGLIVALLAACALGWIARGRGWRAGLAWGLGGLAAVVAVSQLMSVVVEPSAQSAEEAHNKGVRILQRYDVIGAVARDPSFQTTEMGAADPAANEVARRDGAKLYTAQRVDTLGSPVMREAMKAIGHEAIAADWKRLVSERPLLYAQERLAVFRWLVAPPDPELCLPVTVGLEGPRDKIAELGLSPRRTDRDQSLYHYAKRFYRTPLYSHLTYGALAAVTALFLLIRREPADIAIGALMLGALGFAASFLIISLACDHRYLYLLDLAGMTGLFYVALDPRLKPGSKIASQRATSSRRGRRAVMKR